MKDKSGGGMKSVPPKGHSPSVPNGANVPMFKGSTGETGRATPPGLGSTGSKKGNP